MGTVAAVLVVALAVAFVLLRGVGVTVMMWRIFHDSGYPWWIQFPAAFALVVLSWMLFKRYRRGRFDW